MSLAQACAEVEAAIERARSLFVAAAEPSVTAGTAAGHLTAASTSAANAGQGTAELVAELVSAHRGIANRSTTSLGLAAGSDNTLSAHVAQAAALTRSGADRLSALVQELHATSRAAATVTTSAGQRGILTALKSQVDRTAHIVNESQQRAGELTGQIRMLDYPLEPPT